MNIKEFSKTKFMVDLCTWLCTMAALFLHSSNAEFLRWGGTCLIAIVLMFVINRYALHETKRRRPENTIIDASEIENFMKKSILLMPQLLTIYYVVSLVLFNAPVEKVSWVPIVLSIYVGVNLEDISDKSKAK